MEKLETIVLGGGCFWCTEAVFNMLKGINKVTPGYSGGDDQRHTYTEVSNGDTGHAEVIKIDFDREKIKLTDILTVFFGSHDPTTLNRQGNDIGTQYRSVIFYTTPEQEKIASQFIQELNDSSTLGKDIVTEVLPLKNFYEAESYHLNYYKNNPDNSYCEIVINPKLEKVQKNYANLLKKYE